MTTDNPAPDGEPTPEREATAHRLLALHIQAPEPGDGFCQTCVRRWPCPDHRWATRMLRRAQEADHGDG